MSDELLHEYYAENFSDSLKSSIGTPCLVCSETVPIFDYRDVPKICDKCKTAIMLMRKQLNERGREDD